MWQYMEFCGYVGMALFFAAAVLIFWKMRVYDSFLYFLKERQRKRRQRKKEKGENLRYGGRDDAGNSVYDGSCCICEYRIGAGR